MRYFLSFLLFFIAIVIPIKASAQESITLSLDLPPLKMVYELCAFEVYAVSVDEADRWHLTNACLRTVLRPLPI